MNFVEALEGAESHYEREEFLASISLMLVGLGRAIQEAASEEPDWNKSIFTDRVLR